MAESARAPLLALAIAAFGIGTTEFVIMGLLPQVAASLGVGLPAAGLLISGYALGVAFGGPLLAVALLRMPARRTLLALLMLFVLGNLGCALAPDYGLLMAARILTALCHAAFFGTGAVVAARLAPPGRQAQAIATMISGLTLANVLGVPLGTWIGQIASWRGTFAGVAGIGAMAFVASWAALPSVAAERQLGAELRSLRDPSVWLTLAISTTASTSMFAFFTYITPFLVHVAHVPAHRVSVVLLTTGLGLTAGNLIGARLADWRATPGLIGVLVGIVLTLMALANLGHTPVTATMLMTAWGALAFAVCAITQARVVAQAHAAPNLASTLNISAFNLGNALGAGMGAAALARGMDLATIPMLAAGAALLALGLTFAALRADRSVAGCRSCGCA